VYIYLVGADDLRSGLEAASRPSSIVTAAAIYLLAGCLRGFTLIPVTYLIPFGLIFLTPRLQFGLTIVGILVSSASIYYFAEHVRLAEFFEAHHARAVNRVRRLLRRHELAIVTLWSMFPFVPTDVICYVCGALRIDVRKLLVGVLIGEGITCAVYIFLGRQLLSFVV
jgi:uncharacterized membrane protein YdjX (TVP38/TMEM64 family)